MIRPRAAQGRSRARAGALAATAVSTLVMGAMLGMIPATDSPAAGSTAAESTGAESPAVWGFPGHRVVCEIAWRELTPTARDEVRRLTRRDGRYDTFAESCVWADLSEAKDIHNAHWVNLPPGSPAVTWDHCPDDCVLRHLATEVEVLSDAGAGDEARARALRFIGHFVGDVHQPLHVAYAHDRGGNGQEVLGLDDERIDDLHGVWDRHLISDYYGRWREVGRALHETLNPVDRTLWLGSEPLDWANESFQVTEDHVYQGFDGSPGPLPDGYRAANRQTAERQVKKAGVRLGALLNAILEGS